jgi:hypothetical protein
MEEETQKELLRLSKQALALVSSRSLDGDLVFDLRDIIRKAESEMKGDKQCTR